MEAGASSEEGAGSRPVVYGVVSGNPRLLCPHEPRLAGGWPRRAGTLRLVLRDLEVTFGAVSPNAYVKPIKGFGKVV